MPKARFEERADGDGAAFAHEDGIQAEAGLDGFGGELRGRAVDRGAGWACAAVDVDVERDGLGAAGFEGARGRAASIFLGSWSGTRRMETLALALAGMMVFAPGPW